MNIFAFKPIKPLVLKKIGQFESHYKYDSGYMRDMLNYSPAAFAKFNKFLPLSKHRETLHPTDYWIAKLAAVQVADCGECMQLNVRMALEAEVPKVLVQAALKGGKSLPDNLKDVFQYAGSVARNEVVDIDLMSRLEKRYDKTALLEFALCIATGMVFPLIKRALGYAKSCKLVNIEV